MKNHERAPRAKGDTRRTGYPLKLARSPWRAHSRANATCSNRKSYDSSGTSRQIVRLVANVISLSEKSEEHYMAAPP